jgi:hypothetical protein
MLRCFDSWGQAGTVCRFSQAYLVADPVESREGLLQRTEEALAVKVRTALNAGLGRRRDSCRYLDCTCWAAGQDVSQPCAEQMNCRFWHAAAPPAACCGACRHYMCCIACYMC